VTCVVVDPFGAVSDPALPSLRSALEPEEVKRRFKRRLPRLAGEDALVRVRGIRVVRHKPGRRCLVEYDVRVERADAAHVPATVLGKVRAGRYGNADYELADALWARGFSGASADGISIAEPLGTISRFRMWVQRKVPGLPATAVLGSPDGMRLAARIAEAAHKLHEAGVPARRRHGVDDELRILHDCLERVAAAQPRLERRVRRLLASCDRVGRRMPTAHARPIHRDFYADQVIVSKDRLYVIDFDLYCEGDPALDAGNFIGHVTEQALRELGDPAALAPVEEALEERFCELAGERVRASVRAYAALTLARHVYLSTVLENRRHLTEQLLDRSEELLTGHRRHARRLLRTFTR
jgi:Ser/Thr protein kinase RdoA (MazF antagonist)